MSGLVSFPHVLGHQSGGATAEAGVRLVGPRGVLSIIGVEAPKRFERMPLYFRELRFVGSNASGMETFNGARKHAMEHYVDLFEAGAIELSFLVTHRFALDDWRDAFKTAMHKKTGCIKVAFSFPTEELAAGGATG